MQKYIAYYRVSTREQGDSRLGLEAQEFDCKRFVERANGELSGSFKEVESGANDRRPELIRAISEARKQGAKLLIAKLDRLSRNARFIFTLRDSHVDFICCDMPDANTVTIGIMAVMAQNERELTSQRTISALTALKARGVKLGNPNIAQYASKGAMARHANRSENNPNEAAKGIIVNKRKAKMTFSQIANDLNELGMKTTYNKAFSEDNVRLIYKSV